MIGERLWDREHLDQMRAAKLPRDSAPRLFDVRARSEEEVEVAHLRVVPEARELVAVQDDRPLVSAVVSRHDRANSERLRATRCGEGDRLAGREPEAICQVVRDDNSLAPGDGPDRISRVPTNDLPPEQVGVDEAGGDGHRRDARAPVLLAGKDSVRLDAGDAGNAAQHFADIRAERRLQPPALGSHGRHHEVSRQDEPATLRLSEAAGHGRDGNGEREAQGNDGGRHSRATRRTHQALRRDPTIEAKGSRHHAPKEPGRPTHERNRDDDPREGPDRVRKVTPSDRARGVLHVDRDRCDGNQHQPNGEEATVGRADGEPLTEVGPHQV